MIVTIILLSMIVILLGFSIYIMGIISAKLDAAVAFAKYIAERERNISGENDIKKQFLNMMSYSAEEKGDEDE